MADVSSSNQRATQRAGDIHRRSARRGRLWCAPVVALSLICGAGVGGVCLGSAGAASEQRVSADAVQALVAQALYDFSVTKATADRLADARLSAQRKQIDQLRTQGARAAAQLATAQRSFVAALESRDRAYAQAVGVFRKTVQDIAATAEGVAALQRFNAGDELGALAILDKLQASRDQAIAQAANIERAAGRRRIAELALEARARGKLDTSAVLARYEEVTKLDPGVFWDWVELSRLYQDAGRLSEAREAARSAARVAQDARDRCAALDEEGTIAVAQGDLVGAQARFQESLELIKRLAAADPSSARLQCDVSVCLSKVGDVLVAQGDLVGARARFQESLELIKRLAAADPSSARLQRDVWASMWRLVKFSDSGISWAAIAAAMEDMHRRGVLPSADVRFLEEARQKAATEKKK